VLSEIALEGQDSNCGHDSILKQTLQLFTGQPSLAEYAVQCAFGQLAVIGDDNDKFALVDPFLEFDVAASLRNDIESGTL
jgi:hypothetical protein